MPGIAALIRWDEPARPELLAPLLDALAHRGDARVLLATGPCALGALDGTTWHDEAADVAVVDDYAHHPSEIAAALDAARQARPAGRVVAVFQPHLYSRTRAFAREFGAALAAADVAVVTDVYGAREQPVPGVTGSLVAEAARGHGADTHYVPLTRDVPETVAELARAGDLVLTLGAGDITEIGPVILRRLEGSA